MSIQTSHIFPLPPVDQSVLTGTRTPQRRVHSFACLRHWRAPTTSNLLIPMVVSGSTTTALHGTSDTRVSTISDGPSSTTIMASLRQSHYSLFVLHPAGAHQRTRHLPKFAQPPQLYVEYWCLRPGELYLAHTPARPRPGRAGQCTWHGWDVPAASEVTWVSYREVGSRTSSRPSVSPLVSLSFFPGINDLRHRRFLFGCRDGRRPE